MKIIEPGKTKEKWSIQHRCTGWGNGSDGCDALLEIETEDLKYRPGKCETPAAVCFKCPCCGEVTDLGLNDWPKNYRKLSNWTVEWHYNKDKAA